GRPPARRRPAPGRADAAVGQRPPRPPYRRLPPDPCQRPAAHAAFRAAAALLGVRAQGGGDGWLQPLPGGPDRTLALGQAPVVCLPRAPGHHQEGARRGASAAPAAVPARPGRTQASTRPAQQEAAGAAAADAAGEEGGVPGVPELEEALGLLKRYPIMGRAVVTSRLGG